MSTDLDLRTCGAAAWFAWALAQFNLFYSAPKPDDGFITTEAWVTAFRKWLGSGAANTRTRSVGQFLLRFYNTAIKIRGAEPVECVYGGCDDTNRRGVRMVLEHARYF